MLTTKPGENEIVEGEDIIHHLIETARSLVANDAVQSKEFFEKALILSRNISFSNGIGECLVELARIHEIQGNHESALEKLHEAEDCFIKSGDERRLIYTLVQTGEVHLRQGHYENAIQYFHKALHLSEKIHDQDLSGSVLNKLGEISKITGDYEAAVELHKKALGLYESTGNKSMICVTCFHVGNSLNWSNSFDASREYLERSIVLATQIGDPELLIRPTGSLAILFTKLKDFDQAETLFYKSIDLLNGSNNPVLKADILKNLGMLYINCNRFDDAISILNKSLEIVKEINVRYPSNQIHKLLAEAFEKKGYIQQALEHFKLHSLLANEMLTEEVAIKTRSLQFKYDLEQARTEKEIAEKAGLLKDQFIRNLSHEIRTPLNGVLGMVNLLTDTNPSPEQLEYINTIRLSANNLIETIDNILDYSRIQKGEINIEKKEFNLRNLVTTLVQTMKAKADEKNLSMSLIIRDNVPEKVLGDEYRLLQMLTNLISNSIKYTEQGSINIELNATEVKGKETKVLFTVADTGIGISEDRLPHIYESYAIFSEKSGAGLGLAIVKQLVDLQGGIISANSILGSGSVFKVELPFKVAGKSHRLSGGSKLTAQSELKNLTDVEILLVEDNKVNQFLAQKLLTKMGFRVEIASNGNEAVEMLKKKSYDVILMDVQMPEMNGYELTQKIRSEMDEPVKSIPVIALTAYASQQEKEKAMSTGMSDYITKPYSPHELHAAVIKQVQLRRKSTDASSKNKSEITAEMIRKSSDKLINLFSGNSEDVVSLFQMLASQLPALLSETAEYINSKNWRAAFHSIHKLKSSINLIKINALKNYLAELEEWTRDEVKEDRIPVVFATFREECERALKFLRDEIIRLKKEIP